MTMIDTWLWSIRDLSPCTLIDARLKLKKVWFSSITKKRRNKKRLHISNINFERFLGETSELREPWELNTRYLGLDEEKKGLELITYWGPVKVKIFRKFNQNFTLKREKYMTLNCHQTLSIKLIIYVW